MTQPFYFANGQLAHSAEDLLELCKKFPDDGTNYLVREDLEKWLTYIGKEDVARCAASARQTPQNDRQKLEDFLTRCHTLSLPETKPEPETIEAESTPETEATPKPAPVTPAPQTSSASSDKSENKPSFFQIIAKLIASIFYRNKK